MSDNKDNISSAEMIDKKELEKYDLDTSRLKKHKGKKVYLFLIIAVAMSIFQFTTATFGTLITMRQRSLHIMFAFVLGAIYYPRSKKSKKDSMEIADIVLIALILLVFGYIFIFNDVIVRKAATYTTLDTVLGGLAIIVTLLITRRAVGPELPIVAIVFLLYAYLGPYLPYGISHRGQSIPRIISHMYMTTEGIMGIPIGVSATFVFAFILFGAFLDKTGVGQFFIDIAYAITGSFKSGPAMTAVVSSGLMGSISGSSVANTVTTGAFTIPLMKKVGYKPYFAGAVEAAASTGGQIMPPVMGAAAFIMAEFTGVSYLNIIAAAAIPAILYYFAIGTTVHFEACKLGLKGMPRDQLPSAFKILKEKGYLIIPLITIIVLLIKNYTPAISACIAIVVSVVIATLATLIKRDHSFTFRKFIEALEAGAKGAIGVVCACACAGLIVGVVTLTGLGLKIAGLIVSAGQGYLILTLFFTMVASIILGMGLPTTAKYIVLATMAVPALVRLNVNLIAAHLFILYFGVIADITPPVALAAYAGAGIAGANSMKTGLHAVKIALAAFLVPYLFALNPELILVESVNGSLVTFTPLIKAVPIIISAILGIILFAAAVEGYLVNFCNIIERVIMFVGAILLLIPGWWTDIVGLAILIIIFMVQKFNQKKKKKEVLKE